MPHFCPFDYSRCKASWRAALCFANAYRVGSSHLEAIKVETHKSLVYNFSSAYRLQRRRPCCFQQNKETVSISIALVKWKKLPPSSRNEWQNFTPHPSSSRPIEGGAKLIFTQMISPSRAWLGLGVLSNDAIVIGRSWSAIVGRFPPVRWLSMPVVNHQRQEEKEKALLFNGGEECLVDLTGGQSGGKDESAYAV